MLGRAFNTAFWIFFLKSNARSLVVSVLAIVFYLTLSDFADAIAGTELPYRDAIIIGIYVFKFLILTVLIVYAHFTFQVSRQARGKDPQAAKAKESPPGGLAKVEEQLADVDRELKTPAERLIEQKARERILRDLGGDK